MHKAIILTILLIYCTHDAIGQQVPVGSWQSYNTFKSAQAVAVAGNLIYSGKYGLLEYDALTNEQTTYSKVNGLSDVNISHLAWEPISKTLIITYRNNNIDLLKNKRVYNIPDLKNANIVASKNINNISVIDNNFYLATGIGILIIDPIKQEVKNTYPMIVSGLQASVLDVQLTADSIVALTNKGIFKANINNNALQDMSNWRFVSTAVYNKLCIADTDLFLINKQQVVRWDGQQTFNTMYTSTPALTDILYTNNKISISAFEGFGLIVKLQKDGTMVDSLTGQSPLALAADAQGNVWQAALYSGLVKIAPNNGQTIINVDGPYNAEALNMKVIGKDLYVIPGGIDAFKFYNPTYTRNGFSKFSDDSWTTINQFNGYAAMDTILGIMDVEIDPVTKSLYASSFNGGFMELDKNGKITVKKKDNDISSNDPNSHLCTYMHYDDVGNLWQTISNSPKNLVVKKKDGTWQTFNIPTAGDYKVMGDFVVDDANQIWIVLPRSRGLLVFNHNNTLDNKTDDQYKLYQIGANSGNLASNQVISIAKDKDGKIWVGTDNGISIINCPESAFEIDGCTAENKVSTDGIANGYLFATQSVSSIAVDGANRKWIGTNTGVWLLSADADSVLEKFTSNDSPLPDPEIQKIAIDPNTGVVYFATLYGIVSYRGTATEGATKVEEPIVFPNPVAANYTGTISIRGLVENAEVRITDASGKLVFRTKANGGQAIWDGKTYTGYRPNSGVFFVQASNADGSKTQQTKFVFMQ
jgi:hypothetical protein